MVRTRLALSVAAVVAGMLLALAGPAAMASNSPPAVATEAPAVAGAFVSVGPARVLDTRKGTGAPVARVAAKGTVHLPVLGQGGVPVSGVAAVVLNVTVAAPAGSGFVTVFPDGRPRPTVSNLNFVAGQTVPNLVVVPVGANGKVALYNGSGGSTDVLADVAGYYLSGAPAQPGTFVSVGPARVLDTRKGVGAPVARVGAKATVHLPVLGRGGVPVSGVAAVVLNVTVAAPAGSGFLTVFPDGRPRPTVSNLNFVAGQTVPNLVVVPVGANGKVALYNGSAGSADVLADVAGYYLSGAPAEPGTFVSVGPARVLDTRKGTGAPVARVGAKATVHLPVQGQGGVPVSGVAAVVLNVTVAAPAGSGFLTAFPDGGPRPTVSNLNFVPGQTVPNLVVVPVGANGKVALYNGSGSSTDVLADVAGYYLNSAPTATVDLGPTMSPRPDPTVTDFVVSCPSNGVNATITVDAGGSVILDGQGARTTSASVPLPLSSGQAVHWTLSLPGRPDVQQTARCLPADFPARQVTRAGNPASQWYVLAPTLGSGAPAIGNPLYVVVADGHGTPVWWRSTTTHRPVDAKVAPGNGGLMWGEAGIFYALDSVYHRSAWDGTDSTLIGLGAHIDQHDLVPAAEGGWYAIRYVPRDCAGTGGDCADMTAFGGAAAATVVDCEVVRIDESGAVVWSWKSRDHLAFAEWSDLTPASHVNLAHLTISGQDTWDVVHLNSVEDDGDGLIISARHLDAVYRINKSDGSIDWKLGGTPTSRSLSVPGADRDPFLNSQHDARRLLNGHLTVFDNGSEGFRVPRALELDVDEVNRTASIVRSVSDANTTFSSCCGSTRSVAGGGFVTAWGGTGLFTETDAAGDPVLSVDFGSIFTYRVVPVAPGVVSRVALQSGMDTMHPRAAGG